MDDLSEILFQLWDDNFSVHIGKLSDNKFYVMMGTMDGTANDVINRKIELDNKADKVLYLSTVLKDLRKELEAGTNDDSE